MPRFSFPTPGELTEDERTSLERFATAGAEHPELLSTCLGDDLEAHYALSDGIDLHLVAGDLATGLSKLGADTIATRSATLWAVPNPHGRKWHDAATREVTRLLKGVGRA